MIKQEQPEAVPEPEPAPEPEPEPEPETSSASTPRKSSRIAAKKPVSFRSLADADDNNIYDDDGDEPVDKASNVSSKAANAPLMSPARRVGHRYCGVRSCGRRGGPMFHVPKRDPVRAVTWLRNMGRMEQLDKPEYGYTQCCGEHFERKYFMNDNRDRLTWNAVPTIFPIMSRASLQDIMNRHKNKEDLLQARKKYLERQERLKKKKAQNETEQGSKEPEDGTAAPELVAEDGIEPKPVKIAFKKRGRGRMKKDGPSLEDALAGLLGQLKPINIRLRQVGDDPEGETYYELMDESTIEQSQPRPSTTPEASKNKEKQDEWKLKLTRLGVEMSKKDMRIRKMEKRLSRATKDKINMRYSVHRLEEKLDRAKTQISALMDLIGELLPDLEYKMASSSEGPVFKLDGSKGSGGRDAVDPDRLLSRGSQTSSQDLREIKETGTCNYDLTEPEPFTKKMLLREGSKSVNPTDNLRKTHMKRRLITKTKKLHSRLKMELGIIMYQELVRRCSSKELKDEPDEEQATEKENLTPSAVIMQDAGTSTAAKHTPVAPNRPKKGVKRQATGEGGPPGAKRQMKSVPNPKMKLVPVSVPAAVGGLIPVQDAALQLPPAQGRVLSKEEVEKLKDRLKPVAAPPFAAGGAGAVPKGRVLTKEEFEKIKGRLKPVNMPKSLPTSTPEAIAPQQQPQPQPEEEARVIQVDETVELTLGEGEQLMLASGESLGAMTLPVVSEAAANIKIVPVMQHTAERTDF